MVIRIYRIFLLGLVSLSIFGLQLSSARAATNWYVITTGSDSNSCADAHNPCASVNGVLGKGGFVAGDTVKLASGYYFGSGDQVVLIDKHVTLSGGWNTTFDTQAGGISIFHGEDVRRGLTMGAQTVTLDHIQIQQGLDTGGGGGGIQNNNGKLTLLNSWVDANVSPAGATTGQGGGIYSVGANAELTLTDSTVQGSLGEKAGGGIYGGGKIHITRSMIAGNGVGKASTAGVTGGGGIAFIGGELLINESSVAQNIVYGSFNGSGIYVGGSPVVLNNSTIADNRDGDGIYNAAQTVKLHSVTISGNEGFGLKNVGGTVEIANTLIAQNNAGDCSNNATLTDLGYSLVQKPGACVLAGTDITNVYPFLGYFNPNGGPTYTTELYNRSPAIDAGNPTGCNDADGNPLVTDQRGVSRSGACDIGAFEYDPAECENAIPYGPDLDYPYPKSTITKRKITVDWFDQNCITAFSLQVRKTSKKGPVVIQKNDLLISEKRIKLPVGAATYFYKVKACINTTCSKSMWYKFTYKPK